MMKEKNLRQKNSRITQDSNINEKNIKLGDGYFEALGKPRPHYSDFPNPIDKYRFNVAYSYLKTGSVLDIGAYFGDFLKIVKKKDKNREIYATDINKYRVSEINHQLNGKIAILDFRNSKLLHFKNNSVDNIVCTEVLEHIPDNKLAIKELFRVARKRIIITVPFNEEIQEHLCIHCYNYTPSYGHLHSYKLHTFDQYQNSIWTIKKKILLGNTFLNFFSPILKNYKILFMIDKILSKIFINKARWLMIIFDTQ